MTKLTFNHLIHVMAKGSGMEAIKNDSPLAIAMGKAVMKKLEQKELNANA